MRGPATARPRELMAVPFYGRYLALVDEIERRFPVSAWKSGDLDLWPQVRMDLYLDMYWAEAGIAAPRERPLPVRLAGRMAMPLRNFWKSRHDLAHRLTRPTRAHAIFLGDGLSLDRVDGLWSDRFCEPLMAALERRGLATFLMQGGYLNRLPWYRPTFAANVAESRGYLSAWCRRPPMELPDHDAVLAFLARAAVNAHSLCRRRLERRASLIAATATEFERVLDVVRPTLAFVVAFYAGLGPAFTLACRRRGILSIDVQRAPQGGALHAYRWASPPRLGYTTLPAAFWSWTRNDAARINDWAANLTLPCHWAIHGGHTQIAASLDDRHSATQAWNERFDTIGPGESFDREILVALQPIHGHRDVWDALCSQIESSPRSWRWWIRRHPASRPDQDVEAARLLALRRQNVVIEEASALPLPVLLRRMSAVISLASGATVEASMFRVPAFFLLDAAQYSFADLISSGAAKIVDVASVQAEMARLEKQPAMPPRDEFPDIDETLRGLEDRARTYGEMCAGRRGVT